MNLRHRVYAVTFSIIAVLLTGCGGVVRFGELDPPEARDKVIVDVDVDGNDHVSDGDIIDGLANHSEFWASEAPILDTRQLTKDRERLEAFYATRGFFSARVLDVEIEDRSENTVEVTFIVEEGPPTLVSDLEFEGIEDLEVAGEDETSTRLADTRDRLDGLAKLSLGDIWTEADHNATKEAIEDRLRQRGFIFAHVVGQVIVDRDLNEARVKYRISHGPLVRIKDVQVKKNDTASDSRILDRAGLEPGQIIEENELKRAEEDVYDLGFFFFARAEPQGPSIDEQLGDAPMTFANLEKLQWPDEVDVYVTVDEMPVNEFRFGLGARVDNESSDAHVSAGYLVRYFLDNIRHLEFNLSPAWYFIPSFFQPEVNGPGGTATATYREPSVFEEKLDLTVTSQYELTVETAYRQHRFGLTPQLSRRFLRFLRVTLGYGFEYNEFFNVTDDFIGAIDLPQLNLAARGKYILSFLRQGLTIDLRDDIRRTRKGFYGGLFIDESFVGLGSSFDFVKGWVDLRGYVTASIVTFALRVKWGQILSFFGSRIPLSARFRSGGPASMRGFAAGRMGPKLCLPNAGDIVVADDKSSCPAGTATDEQIYIGGNILAEASFEARVAIGQYFGVVGFVDVGELWEELSQVDFSELNVAVGPGLRGYTGFGAIRFDFAFLLTTPSPPDFQFHFSIGQTF